MLTLLHDHMDRRTVENPDLAHRAARQGLAGKIRELESQGYTVIEHAISAEFADEVRAAVLRALLPHQTFSMNWMLYHVRFAYMQKLLAFNERQKQAILAGANG